MTLALLAALAAAGLILIVLSLRRRNSERPAASPLEDTGQAIMEFGRAYPALPIRDVVLTEDRRTAFLRLADARAGVVHASGRHFLSRLIVPGAIRVGQGPDERTLSLRFEERSVAGGDYRFATSAEAAEVSLWLVGTLLAEHEAVEREVRDGPRNA